MSAGIIPKMMPINNEKPKAMRTIGNETVLRRDGRTIEREAEGFHARVVQHECDHLVGVLYPMRVRDFSRFGFTSVLFPELDADADD